MKYSDLKARVKILKSYGFVKIVGLEFYDLKRYYNLNGDRLLDLDKEPERSDTSIIGGGIRLKNGAVTSESRDLDMFEQALKNVVDNADAKIKYEAVSRQSHD